MYLPPRAMQQLAHILWSCASASPRCGACTLLLANCFCDAIQFALAASATFCDKPRRMYRFPGASHKFQVHRTGHEVFAMQKLICRSLIFIALAAAVSRAAADDGGWKIPNLNPFSGGS